MKRFKLIISFVLIVMVVFPFSILPVNASSYYDLVKDSKASENFDDDKVNVGIDETQRRNTDYSVYNTYNIIGEQTVEVRATQHTTYTAKVPAILIVDGAFKPNDTNDFSFEVSVEGNIAGDAMVKLQPDNSFMLSSYGKDEIPASITQEKTKFTYEDGVRINNPVSTMGFGKVQNMTAGLWFGSWNYNIRLLPIVDYDCYTWADDDYTTGQITGITELGKDKLETFGIMLFPEPNEADNYDGVKSISSDVSALTKGIDRTDCDIVIPKTLERIEDSVGSQSPFGFGTVNKVIFEKPSSLKYIGNCAFTCANIKEPIEIPASVEELGTLALAEINGYLSNSSKYAYISFEQGSKLKTIGDQAFRYANVTGKLILPEGLETIGTEAFSYCNYSEIAIPDSVTTIENHAFSKRTANGTSPFLKLNFPANLTNWSEAFAYSAITQFVIPDTITIIPANAFKSCSNLTKITMSPNLTRIGGYAFAYTALSSVTIPDKVEYLGHSAFNGTKLTSLVLPDSINELGGSCNYGEESPVYNCKLLTSITIGKNTPNLDKFNFSSLTKLATITLNGTKNIASSAFARCAALTTLNINPGVETIGSNAFSGCSKLIKVNFTGTINEWFHISFENAGSDPTFITRALYLNNKPVTSITIPSWLENVGASYSEGNRCVAWTPLTSVVIEEGVSEINSGAFENCSNLTYIKLPQSLTRIGSNAFSYCSQLKSIVLPSDITEIESNTFSSSGLTSITIPDNVTVIGSNAFRSCKSLVTVNLSSGLKTIGEYAFSSCTATTNLTIPNSVETIERYAFNSITKQIRIDNVEGSISGSPWGARASNIVWLREAE
ncbi:MAG: leucine-rich repeat domain-containing protein [Clostridia bacterium]|nr:leucine-rich repeat domain-containing protein [Clostridia bacterium]MBR0413721.1 leucine-rich repeat domain-containing protein [Clostridia bacterium]